MFWKEADLVAYMPSKTWLEPVMIEFDQDQWLNPLYKAQLDPEQNTKYPFPENY